MRGFSNPKAEGIRYAKILLSMAEDYKKEKKEGSIRKTQKLFGQIRRGRRNQAISRKMNYLLLRWLQYLSTLPEWKEEELWAVRVAKMAVGPFPELPKCRLLFFRISKRSENTAEETIRKLLGRISHSERDAFMEGFWMQLKTAKREKQQHLTEFFLEWIWITPEKTLELENLRYWAADYCLPFV